MVEYNLSLLNRYNKLKITNNSIIFENRRFGKTKIKNSSIDSVQLVSAQVSTKTSFLLGVVSGIPLLLFRLDFITLPGNTLIGFLFILSILLILYTLFNIYFGKLTIYTRSKNYTIICSRNKCQNILNKL